MPVIPGRPPPSTPPTTLATDAEVAASAAATRTYARGEGSGQAPTVVSLMSCQADESYSVTNCTVDADETNYKVGNQGLEVTIGSAVTATVILDPPGPTDPLTMGPASAIGLWVWLDDATKITSLTLELWVDAALTTGLKWARTASTGLVDGWNLLRWASTDSNYENLDTIYRVRVIAVTNAATVLTVGHVWAECPPKAQVLIINDGGYKTFMDEALEDLRTLSVPITWALSPGELGTETGTKAERITEADVATIADAGDSISFHSWEGAVTSSMTEDEIATDTMKAIRWLQQRGYAGRIWRAAWTQNAATNAAAARPYVLAYATPTSVSSQTAWPPPNRWNIPRTSIHGRSEATIDGIFEALELTHGLYVFYTHGIHVDGDTDTTPDEWDYFMIKLSAALDEGWLECVTFEDLYARSGGKFRQALGDAQYEYVDDTGTVVEGSML